MTTLCPRCGSTKVQKKGTRIGKQRYKCKECDANFTEGVPYKSTPIIEGTNPVCIRCGSAHVVRDGKLLDGSQKYYCVDCNLHFSNKTELIKSNKEEVLKLIFSGLSISQVVEKTNLSPDRVRKIAKPFYERELNLLTKEKKKLIIQYGYYLQVPIDYIAEYVPCSRRACELVLANYKKKVEENKCATNKNKQHLQKKKELY